MEQKTVEQLATELFPEDTWGRMIWMDGYKAALAATSQPLSPDWKEKAKELFEEGEELMIKLLPPEEFGEDYDCERLHEILGELRDASTPPAACASQAPSEEEIIRVGEDLICPATKQPCEEEICVHIMNRCEKLAATPPAACASPAKEEEPLYTELVLGSVGNTMTVNCFDEDSEMSIVIRDNGRKCIYSMKAFEVSELVKYLTAHLKNEITSK